MRLTYDPENNSLRLVLDDETTPGYAMTRIQGIVDVAANGRLVGVELGASDGAPAARRRLRRWLDDPVAGEFTSVEPNGTAYIELTVGEPDEEVRSSTLDVLAESTADGELVAVVIPRHGPDYEISYPSGNR